MNDGTKSGNGEDSAEFNNEVREIWDTNAEWWDDFMGEGGNQFQRKLLGPASERLLQLQPGELVLDVGCGGGAFSRQMARLGARVVAFDFSEKFLARARERSAELADRIEYRLVDATDEGQLLSLGEDRFDAAVSTMAIMDMAAIEPLAAGLRRLLKPGGRLVFSVLHPCFNSGVFKKVVEEEDIAGELITVYSIKVSSYIKPFANKGLGVIGQPVAQYYFHRPLYALFTPFFQAGFAMNGIEEPVFGDEGDASRPFSWYNYKEIPPVLVVRMRLPG